jgi:hypothetical protein
MVTSRISRLAIQIRQRRPSGRDPSAPAWTIAYRGMTEWQGARLLSRDVTAPRSLTLGVVRPPGQQVCERGRPAARQRLAAPGQPQDAGQGRQVVGFPINNGDPAILSIFADPLASYK